MTLALARMVDSLGNSFLIVVLPLYIASGISGSFFGLSEALITGIILSTFGFLNSFGQPFAGRLSDRVGKRTVFVLCGLAILALGNVAYLFTSSYAALIVIRAVQGLGVALTIPAVIALVNEYTTGATRGGDMGIYNTFRLLGFGSGPMIAGAVVHSGPYSFSIVGRVLSISGYEAAFYIAAIATALSFVLVGLFVRDPEETQATAGEDLQISFLARDSERTLDPVFTLALASLFVAIGIALLETLQPRVNDRLNQTAFMFGIEFAAFMIPQAILQTPIGRASDHHGRKPFILWGLVLLAPATLAQGLVQTPLGMIVARAVQGLAGAMVFAPALALAGDFTKKGQSGTQLSLVTMMFGLGIAIGPLTSGYLVRYGFVIPFAFGAALAVIGIVLVATQVYDPDVHADESQSTHGRSAPQD
jgi:MFS family permease